MPVSTARAAMHKLGAAPPTPASLPPPRTPDGTAQKAAPQLLADVQHELRVPRHPVRLGAAAREHVGGLRAARREAGPGPAPLAGSADDGIARAADHRCAERPHLGAAGAAT